MRALLLSDPVVRCVQARARCFIFPVPLIRLAATRGTTTLQVVLEEQQRLLSLSLFFVLSILASVSRRDGQRNVRTRVSRSGPPGRSLHYVNSPPLASSASSRARAFLVALLVRYEVMVQRRFRMKCRVKPFRLRIQRID